MHLKMFALKLKWTQIQRTDCWLPRGRRVGAWVKKVKRSRSTDWKLDNSHRDVKHGGGNTVSNMVMTTYGARSVLELSGGSLCKV